MNNELISIIIPVYNVEKYLCECLDSVINQTYKNLEIILVDDGSTDNSGSICDKYHKKDNRIKVIHKMNGGVSSARNYGLNVATGKYINFIDPDDWVENNFIECLYSYANKDTIVCCSYNRIENNKIVIHSLGKLIICDKLKFVNLLKDNELKGNEGKGIDQLGSSMWNKLFPAWVFQNIRFPKGKTSEDIFIILKLFNKIEKVILSPASNYNYRARENSIVSTITKSNLINYLEAHLEQERDLQCYCDDNLLKKEKLLINYIAIKNYSLHCYEFYKLNKSEIKILKDIIRQRRQAIPSSLWKLKFKVFLFLNAEFMLKFIYKLKMIAKKVI